MLKYFLDRWKLDWNFLCDYWYVYLIIILVVIIFNWRGIFSAKKESKGNG